MANWITTLPRRMAAPRLVGGFSIGHCALAVFAFTVLAMAVHFVAYLVGYALPAVRYPFELDYGEGIVWQQAMLIPGARMYGDITRFPFIVFHYPPFYHLLLRGAAVSGLNVLATGRAISLLSSFGIGVLAAALAFRAVREEAGRTASLTGAAVAGLAVFCFWPVDLWSPLLRVDMLAIALSFLGVWCAVRSVVRPWLLYLALILFVLAVYTKQTCVAAPLATVPVMLLVAPRRTLKASCLGLLLGVAALLLLTWQTDGGFLRHILLYNLNRYNLRVAARVVREQQSYLTFLVLAAAAIVMGWKRLADGRALESFTAFRRELVRSDTARLLTILTLYLGFSTCTLATLGKSGGNVNYLVEWMCVLSVPLGMLSARIVERELGRLGHAPAHPRSAVPLAVAVALLVQVLTLPPISDVRIGDAARTQQLGQLLERVRAAKAPVLSDDMVLLMKAGKEVPWEPSIFAELASTGRWDEQRIISMIDAHKFAFIITQGHPGIHLYDSRYTPAVEHAIETAYPRLEEYAQHTIHLPPAPP